MEAQITTRYRAKYAVTIMGKGYAPGDEIVDPKIDGRVLRRLADNGRVILVPHVHVPYSTIAAAAGEFDDDEPDELPDDDEGDDEDDETPPVEPPVEPAEGGGPGDTEGAAVAAVKAAAQPVTTKAAVLAGPALMGAGLNAAWKAAFAKNRENGETLKGYLQRVLQQHQIKANGPVQELVNRLASAGVQPGVAGH